MSTLSILTQFIEHAWEPKKTKPSYAFQERYCPICELWDRRHWVRKPHDKSHGWQIETGCIIPVPDRVDYEDLVLELVEHGLGLRPWCIGAPGQWTVGFVVARDSKPYPAIKLMTHEDLNNGFAHLTRWIRVRQYRPDMYSHAVQYGLCA